MTSTATLHRSRRQHSWPALVGFILVTVGSGFVVGQFTQPGTWYDQLDKPPLQPPSVVFGPVWTVLYVMIAVAGYLAWRSPASRDRTIALVAWAVQLGLNLAWSMIFFGAQRPGWALAEMLVLLGAIAATIVLFARLSRVAALLLVPYAAWVVFATYLTVGIVVAN